MTKNTALTIFVIVLVLVLGLMIAGYMASKKGAVTLPTTLSPLSEVLTSLPQDASAEKREQYRKFVRDLAVEGNIINVSADCKVEPVVLRIKLEESVTVNNQDTIEHRINSKMGGAKSIIPVIVSAGDSTAFRVSDFVPSGMDPRGGVVRYGCDDIVSGILYIVP